MNLNLDSKNFRDQIKLLKELTNHLEKAAAICDTINGSTTIVATTGSGKSPELFDGANNFAPGNRKANLDIAFKILEEVGKPLHKNELLKLARERGSNLTNADTFSLYMKKDDRFSKADPGHWKLNKDHVRIY